MDKPATASPPEWQPLIWLVIGDKLGDNAQAKIIADSLALPYEVKHLRPLPAFETGKPHFRVSLEHLDLQRSDSLSPPWPDLVITIGRRHSMAALWIKRQSPATRLVLIGRPRRWIDRFDLVITLPQYSLPDLPNVMRLSLPLMRTDTEAVKTAARSWEARLQALPRPLIAVLIGGATRPFRFNARTTAKLLRQCGALQSRLGGTLYFSTSRRTSAEIVNALKKQLPAGAQLFEWQAGSSDNPYLALLGLADCFVVTGDSVSMMIEVADCGKPLAIFSLPSGWYSRLWQGITRRLHAPPGAGRDNNRLYRALGRLLYRSGLVGFSRDLTRINDALIHGGFAVRAGEEFRAPPGTGLPDERPPIRERILALLDR
jgi:uncharacterized protein